MRNRKTALLALITAIAAVGLLPAASSATSVVDQYTEHLPDPGGPVPVDPAPEPKPDKNGSGNNDSGGYISSTPAPVTAPVETDTSTNVKKKNKPKKKKSQDKAEAAATKHKKVDTGSTTDPTIQSAVPTSGVSSDEGMGWLFPAMLVAVTAAAIGFTVGRRRSGSSRPS